MPRKRRITVTEFNPVPLQCRLHNEVLLENSLRYVERAVAAGVDARVDVWEGMVHGFLSGIGTLAASNEALEMIATFLNRPFDPGRELNTVHYPIRERKIFMKLQGTTILITGGGSGIGRDLALNFLINNAASAERPL